MLEKKKKKNCLGKEFKYVVYLYLIYWLRKGTKHLAAAFLDQKQKNTVINVSSDWPQSILNALKPNSTTLPRENIPLCLAKHSDFPLTFLLGNCIWNKMAIHFKRKTSSLSILHQNLIFYSSFQLTSWILSSPPFWCATPLFHVSCCLMQTQA